MLVFDMSENLFYLMAKTLPAFFLFLEAKRLNCLVFRSDNRLLDFIIAVNNNCYVVFTRSQGRAGLRASQSANLPSSRRTSTHRPASHNDFCFSRVSPLQKQRIEQVEMIEQALKKHPLALYPHLEECVPPEVGTLLAS